ncbi:MAG: hypothetical protein WC736_15380 [Gallionella sp.]|jgi:hypothetical protein
MNKQRELDLINLCDVALDAALRFKQDRDEARKSCEALAKAKFTCAKCDAALADAATYKAEYVEACAERDAYRRELADANKTCVSLFDDAVALQKEIAELKRNKLASGVPLSKIPDLVTEQYDDSGRRRYSLGRVDGEPCMIPDGQGFWTPVGDPENTHTKLHAELAEVKQAARQYLDCTAYDMDYFEEIKGKLKGLVKE